MPSRAWAPAGKSEKGKKRVRDWGQKNEVGLKAERILAMPPISPQYYPVWRAREPRVEGGERKWKRG